MGLILFSYYQWAIDAKDDYVILVIYQYLV